MYAPEYLQEMSPTICSWERFAWKLCTGWKSPAICGLVLVRGELPVELEKCPPLTKAHCARLDIYKKWNRSFANTLHGLGHTPMIAGWICYEEYPGKWINYLLWGKPTVLAWISPKNGTDYLRLRIFDVKLCTDKTMFAGWVRCESCPWNWRRIGRTDNLRPPASLDDINQISGRDVIRIRLERGRDPAF